MSILLCSWAWQPCNIESLYLHGQPTIVGMLWDTIKGMPWSYNTFFYSSVINFGFQVFYLHSDPNILMKESMPWWIQKFPNSLLRLGIRSTVLQLSATICLNTTTFRVSLMSFVVVILCTVSQWVLTIVHVKCNPQFYNKETICLHYVLLQT